MNECPVCKGFGVLASSDHRMTVPCSCRPDAELWRAARIPERYADAPLTVAATIPTSKLFYGPVGRGKTRMAVSLLKGVARLRTGCRFVDLPTLELSRRAAIRQEIDILPGDALAEAPFLVLDDLAREPRMTDFWEEFLSGLIRERYNMMLPAIWTSNHNPAQLENRIGAHLSSRILEMCRGQVVEITGRDWRAS